MTLYLNPIITINFVLGLTNHNLTPNDIDFVICTHGHSDHVGNNNLFLNAKLIVGFCVSHKDRYEYFPFKEGEIES